MDSKMTEATLSHCQVKQKLAHATRNSASTGINRKKFGLPSIFLLPQPTETGQGKFANGIALTGQFAP
jgi:hypothetical protein